MFSDRQQQPTTGSVLNLIRGGLVVGALLGLVACSAPTDTEPGEIEFGESFDAFRQDCEEGLNDWRPARMVYPDTLTLTMNQAGTYNAVADTGDVAPPPDEVITIYEGTADAEEIFVQCVLAARLVAVDDGITVEGKGEDTGGWLAQTFTPGGRAEWDWSVTAVHPVDQELRLELRPSVSAPEAGIVSAGLSSFTQSTFTTDVTVKATPIEGISYWFETQWPLVTGIAVTLGAAIAGVWVWWKRTTSG